MKKISILSFLAATLFMASCQKEETADLGRGKQWLQFGQSTYSVAENASQPLKVNVYYAADTNPNDITVEYTVTSEDTDRYDPEPITGTVVIPAGEFSAEILIDPIDDLVAEEDAKIVLELNAHPEIPLGLVGEGFSHHTTTITIVEDDCPVDIESFVGVWSVTEGFTSGTNEGLSIAGLYGETYLVDVSLVPGDETGTQLVFNIAEGTHQYFVPGTIITLRTCSQTFEFNAGNPIVGRFDVLSVQTTTFDDRTMTITANGPLGPYGPYQFVMTKVSE